MHFIVTLTFYSLMPSRELPISDFAFLNCSFRSGLIWYWILISPGNGKHQCTTARAWPQRERAEKFLLLLGYYQSSLNIWYLPKMANMSLARKGFLPLLRYHLIFSPSQFSDLLTYIYKVQCYLISLAINAWCPIWELGQASPGNTDFRWHTYTQYLQGSKCPHFRTLYQGFW